MTDVNRLLRDYIERYEAEGAPDASDLLEQVQGRDRAELLALIEGYLEHAAPSTEWDPGAFEGSIAQRASQRVMDAWEAESAPLPRELVALRKERKLKRSSLVERLAAALGFPGEVERVGVYYNAMEHGQLQPWRISRKVYDALANVFEVSSDRLWKAGESVAPSAGGEPGAVFARAARVEAAGQPTAPSPGRASDQLEESEEIEPDELDRLFIGD